MIVCCANQCAFCRSSIVSGQRWVREKIPDNLDDAQNNGRINDVLVFNLPLWRTSSGKSHERES